LGGPAGALVAFWGVRQIMTTFQVPRPSLDVDSQTSTTPLVVLFERDDAIAVPMLSQLRIAGYDVRAARTPVELFDITSKQLVALILIDLGSATAGRREFWVALDTQRRGRSIQVMTFRYSGPDTLFDADFEPSARAIAEVEVHGTHEFQLILEGVRQRVPLGVLQPPVNGQIPLLAGLDPLTPRDMRVALQPGVIPPIGAALGIPSPFMQAQPGMLGMAGTSPFAHPASSNPFIETGDLFSGSNPPSPFSSSSSSSVPAAAGGDSPFAQPYSSNPFGSGETAAPAPTEAIPSHAFGYQMDTNPTIGSLEERAARLSQAYAAEFGLTGTMPTAAAPAAVMASGVFNHGQSASPWDPRDFFDSWTPPGATEVDSVLSPVATSSTLSLPAAPGFAREDEQEMAFTPTEYAPALPLPTVVTESVRKAARSPGVDPRRATPADESLGEVLVEGALLSEQKLEALRGVQDMLSNVQIDFKLGELALLFKFLSPDQLLAALLVSRGLVTPAQIANLGRTKQDLASSGMEYTLADLLVMFDILPEDQVTQIRKEIAS
jgi:hypothetical protein